MTDDKSDINAEGAFYRKKLFLSILIPGIFVMLMWLVKAIEVLFDIDLTNLGIYPLKVKGLPGILLSPFIHSDLKHLFNNSLASFSAFSCAFLLLF